MITEGGTMWWQGYNGEEVVLFDDYRGETSFSEMLLLTHEYRHEAPTKGAHSPGL